jgi:large subunit ribosomal protein L9
MRLILTEDITNLGRPGDVVEVKDGYGRNYLLPRGLAVGWTKGGEKQVTQIKRAQRSRAIRDVAHAQELKVELERTPIRLAVRAGATGRLFGSVTGADIAAAVKSAGGPDIDKRKVGVHTGIKTVGRHEVILPLHPDVSAKIALDVVKA